MTTFAAVHARRLARHGLTRPLGSVPGAVVAMAGAHAQVMSAAEVSVGLRVAGAREGDVADALWRDRTLVKTYGPRGTVHLLATADLPWWTAALGSVPAAGGHVESVRLSPTETDAVVAAIATALADGGELTTEELDERVGRSCGPWAVAETMPAFGGFWPRWRQALGVAAGRGELCFGRLRARKVTYAAPTAWLPGLQLPAPEDAQLELLRAYLTAYGPATPAHLARWLATSPTWAADLFARGEVEEVDLDGEPAWVRAGDTTFDAPAPPGVCLLPYFDAFQVGSQPRERLFAGRAAERALARRQAGNYPVLLLDGVVGGVWHQRRSGRRLVVTVEPLGRLSAAQRSGLDDEVERVAALQGTRPTLTVGTVSVGPHA